jgi:hypothetical protein
MNIFERSFRNRIRRSVAVTLVVLLAGAVTTPSSRAATSGIFGGGPFYKSATNNINEIKNSGFTEAIVWNIEVTAI